MRLLLSTVVFSSLISLIASNSIMSKEITDSLVQDSDGVIYQMTPDTIEILGKFLSGCANPAIIKIAEHNELGGSYRTVTVNPNGEFTYRLYLAEPRRIEVKTTKGVRYDFIATTNEKGYAIEIGCVNGMEKPELKGSAENTAYRPFSAANKKFRENLDSLGKLDLSKPEVFSKLKNTISEYQKTLAGIISFHPGTFTATVLCAAERLPDGSLNTIETFRQNFLQREAFANPQLFNDFLGGRIISNYLSIRDKNADPLEAVTSLLNIAMKNPDAAKRLQQVTYNLFWQTRDEKLMVSYIKWAETNPTSMYNQSVKMQLSRLNKVMPGKQLIDIQLNDTSGTPRSLRDDVNSGKLTLLVFYEPTCSHCNVEIPQLKPVWEQYVSKGLKIYIVASNSSHEEWNWFIKNKAYSEWTHVFDSSGNTLSQYAVNGFPTYILIDSQGKIISRMAEFEDVKNDIPKLLD